jgi:hypothetical protein
MAELKAKPTDVAVRDRRAAIDDDVRRADCEALVTLMTRATGCDPVMGGRASSGSTATTAAARAVMSGTPASSAALDVEESLAGGVLAEARQQDARVVVLEPRSQDDRGVRTGDAARAPGPRRVTLVLAAAVTALMVVQAVTGMIVPGVYRDEGFALDAWRVNDPVTLFVAAPLALTALGLAWRGSTRALLVLLGVMQYALYNYAFYLFGAALNAHFLLYVAAFVASGLALVAGLVALDRAAVARAFGPRMPARLVAAYMAFWAVTLGVAWISQAVAFAVTGVEPGLGADAFRLIAALDLSMVVTPVAIGAVWLWVRRVWGVVIAVVLNVKGAIYAFLLAVGSALGGSVTSGGGDGLLGLWAFFVVGSSVSLVVLLTALRAVDASAAASSTQGAPAATEER